MSKDTRYPVIVALIAALGGFLMGFDASVISGVVRFIEPEFDLSKIELGWAVASLTLSATVGMMFAGPLSDRIGRRPVLKIAAIMFTVSAIASAVAPDYASLVIARLIGGFGVGASLIIAPMYIAELAPARLRGRLVSLNQLNIVIGISAAFFSNYLIVKLGQSAGDWAGNLRIGEWNWRWMLGLETLPAVIYFIALHAIPESPRWLVMRGREAAALGILERVGGTGQARADLALVRESLESEAAQERVRIAQLFSPSMKLVMTIGISIAILQQITGINAVFFYAPMIFEQSGVGTDASFMQAVLVGIVNLVFTVFAILLIDRLGRRPLLGFGLAGIAVCMLMLAYGFGSATYTLTDDAIDTLPDSIERSQVEPLRNRTFDSDLAFRHALKEAVGVSSLRDHEPALVTAAISMNQTLILAGILGFVASFAISIGPVMWVLFAELFPNSIRGLAISFVGLINSAVSFTVQLVFPWQLSHIGNAATFLIYAIFAIAGYAVVMRLLPETKGKSLEQLQALLVRP